jgi:hypothetical protein
LYGCKVQSMATCRQPMKAAISSKRSDVISTLAYVHTRGRHTMPPSLLYKTKNLDSGFHFWLEKKNGFGIFLCR